VVSATAAWDSVPDSVNLDNKLSLPFLSLLYQFSIQRTRNAVTSLLPVNQYAGTEHASGVAWTQIYYGAEAKDELRILLTNSSASAGLSLVPISWSISVFRLQQNYVRPVTPPCDPCRRHHHHPKPPKPCDPCRGSGQCERPKPAPRASGGCRTCGGR